MPKGDYSGAEVFRRTLLRHTLRLTRRGAPMPGYLTTHVLDTARGCPAAGLTIDLYRLEGGARSHLCSLVTNADGRTDGPILPEAEFAPGIYELVFHAGDYLEASDASGESPRFLDLVPIRFGMAEEAHYHVPLLLSPYGYSTYRGS
jgi:5-hydroxyisourate hydrolase